MRRRVVPLPLILLAAFIGVTFTADAQTKGKTKYLVIAEFIDPGPLMPPPQVVQLVEQTVLPGLELLAKWESEKKISGGIYVGQKKGAFVMEAETNEEVDKMLQSIPFWGLMKWEVVPLHSFAGRAAQDKVGMEMLKSTFK